MSMTKDQLLDEARNLNPAARAELIEDLRQLPEAEDDLTPQLRAELARRIAKIERGEEVFHDGPQAMSDLFRQLATRR
jgi:hypothetical protein